MATLLYYWNFTGADANTSELLNNPNERKKKSKNWIFKLGYEI